MKLSCATITHNTKAITVAYIMCLVIVEPISR